MDEQQASGTEDVASGSAAPDEAAPETQTDEADDRKQLSDKLAERGRELKAERAARNKAETALTDERTQRELMWYKHEATDDEKETFRKERERAAKEAPKLVALTNEKELLKAIANEDDSKVRKALKAIYSKAEATGKFPDPDTIQALRESLQPTEDEETKEPKPDEKAPVKITLSRGTRSVQPTVEDQLKEIEKSMKAKDGRFNYNDWLVVNQERTMAKQAAERG